MKVSVVTIGDELLNGHIVDTNAVFIATQIDKMGGDVVRMHSVSDNYEEILAVMTYELGKSDVCIMTGGLGPTNDDVTKRAFSDFFSKPLLHNEALKQHIESLLSSVYKDKIPKLNDSQALVPKDVLLLKNRVGTASGMLLSKEKTQYVSLPGVPYEMRTLVIEELLPYLKTQFTPLSKYYHYVYTEGIGESKLAEELEDWESNLPKDIRLAYLPKQGRVKLRLTLRGFDLELMKANALKVISSLPESILPFVKSYDQAELAELIIKELQIRNKTISFAESCTGGQLSVQFNKAPGASQYFKGGVVCYATSSKTDVLGVPAALIEQFGVVSEEVAKEMALRAKNIYRSNFAISTTGNAGPTKGDDRQDVGTVCIGIATETEVFSFTFRFREPRENVVRSALCMSLELFYNEILKSKQKSFV